VRQRLIVCNWKMHKTAAEAAVYLQQLSALVPRADPIEVVLAPPFTALHVVGQSSGHPFGLAAQDLFWDDTGPYTGEVSAPMLTALGCRYVILGHSERRQLFGEDDAGANKKVRAALRHGLRPILCVGESLSQRDRGDTENVVRGQLLRGLEGLSKEESRTVTIAYEPVWAIGTGRAASPEQITATHQTLRSTLADSWGSETGEQVRILYGGSVTPDNVSAFLASAEVDGALVGGACLDPHSLAKIVACAQSSQR